LSDPVLLLPSSGALCLRGEIVVPRKNPAAISNEEKEHRHQIELSPCPVAGRIDMLIVGAVYLVNQTIHPGVEIGYR